MCVYYIIILLIFIC